MFACLILSDVFGYGDPHLKNDVGHRCKAKAPLASLHPVALAEVCFEHALMTKTTL